MRAAAPSTSESARQTGLAAVERAAQSRHAKSVAPQPSRAVLARGSSFRIAAHGAARTDVRGSWASRNDF